MADAAPGLDLTPEQEIELARARAAAAQKQQEREAEINAAAGISDAPSNFGAVTKEFGRSVGEGFTGLADLPERIYTGLKNFPRRLQNTSLDVAAPYGVDPEEFKANQPAPVKLDDPYTPVNTAYNAYFPPNPDYPEVRKAGNIAGSVLPAIVAPELLAGEFSALPAAADVVTTTAGTYGGGKAGRAIDEAFGGSGDTGETIGSLFGGFTTPLVRTLYYGGANKLLTDANSAARLQDADTAGVTPDLSLVGNDRAARWGSRGSSAADLRAAQQEQIDEMLREAARARSGRGIGPTRPISKGDVGTAAADTARSAAELANADANRIFDPLSTSEGGRSAPVDVSNLAHGFERSSLQPRSQHGQRADDRLFPEPARSRQHACPRPGARGAAPGELLAPTRNLASAQPGSPLARAAQANVDQTTADIAANRGPSWNQLLAQRSVGNRSLDTAVSFDKRVRGDIKGAQTEALRAAAAQRGYPPEEFNAVNEQFGGLKTDQKTLEKIANAEAGPAYNKVFGPAAEQDAQRLALLQQHADPGGLGRLLADNLELRSRGPAAAGRPELPRDVGLNPNAPDWWMALPEETRRAYATDPAVRGRIDATMNLIRADARRGGGQAGQSDLSVPLSLGGAAVTGNPAALAGLTPRVASSLFGRQLRRGPFTRQVVAGAPPLTIKDLARTMAAAVGAGATR